MHSLANKQRVLSWTHIAGAIAWGLEIHQESSNRAIRTTCVALSTPCRKLRKTNVQTSTSDRSRRVNACERQFALSCSHSARRLAVVTARILHVSSMVCSRSIGHFLVLLPHWRVSDGITPIVGQKLAILFCSNPAAAEPRHGGSGDLCQKHDLSTTSLMRWARRLLSADVQNIRGICPRGRRNGSRIKSR